MVGAPVSSPQALAPEKKATRTIAAREVRDEEFGLSGGSKPLRDRTLFFIASCSRTRCTGALPLIESYDRPVSFLEPPFEALVEALEQPGLNYVPKVLTPSRL